MKMRYNGFFGLIILGTRFNVGSRRELWATSSISKFIEAPKFGEKTNMSMVRFDALWSCICLVIS